MDSHATSSETTRPRALPPAPWVGASAFRRYALAVVATALAFLVTRQIGPWLRPNILSLFFAAVLVSAWYGGLGPGLLAALLSVVTAGYYFTEPVGSFAVQHVSDVVRLGLFLLIAVVASSLSESLRSARARAERKARESAQLAWQLEERTSQLEQQATELEHHVEESRALARELETTNRLLADAVREAEAARQHTLSILESISDGFISLDRQWRYTFVNAQAARLLGRTPDELIGKSIWEVFPGAVGTRAYQQYQRAMREGVAVSFEDLSAVANSWTEIHVYPSADGISVYFHDVTARRRAEDALRESEARFRTLADTAPVMIWQSDTDSRHDFFNTSWLAFTGRTAEQELGSGWTKGVHPDDLQRCLDTYRAAFEARREFKMEFRLRRHDGEYRWVLDHGVPRFLPDGTFAGYIGSCIDITERKQGEMELRAIAETIPQVVWTARADGSSDYFNERWYQYSGLTPEQSLGTGWLSSLHPEDMAPWRERWTRAVASGEPFQSDCRFRAHDGGFRWFLARALPLRDQNGRIARWFGTCTDIDDQKRGEQAQRFLAEASRALSASLNYETTLENVARLAVPQLGDFCAIDLFDADGSIERVVSVHVDPVKEALMHRAAQRAAPGSVSQTSPAMIALRTGRPVLRPELSVLEVEAADAEQRRLARAIGVRSLICVPLVAHGRTLGVLSLGISDSARPAYGGSDLPLAEELARRIAFAVGNAWLYRTALAANQAKADFLAVMSHELRTPLNAIVGYTDLLASAITGPVTARQLEQLDRIKASSRHLLNLIEEILTYSRLEAGRERVRLETVDVASLVREAVSLIESLARAQSLPVRVELPAEPVEWETDPGKARQILVNLLSNAVKFTERGAITVSAAVTGKDVQLRVRDTGVGIAREHLEKIFEPFWQVEQTTRRRVGGTGLGLSVARRLAELLGGQVTVESTPGAGSTFTVTLPLCTSEALGTSPARETESARTAS